MNLVAAGQTYGEAVEELVELAEQQAQNFLERLDFYMQTDRRGELAWLLKVALTSPERRSDLLFAPASQQQAEMAQPA